MPAWLKADKQSVSGSATATVVLRVVDLCVQTCICCHAHQLVIIRPGVRGQLSRLEGTRPGFWARAHSTMHVHAYRESGCNDLLVSGVLHRHLPWYTQIAL